MQSTVQLNTAIIIVCAINNCNYNSVCNQQLQLPPQSILPCNQTCNQRPQSKTQSKQSHDDQQSRQSLQSTSIAYCTISWYMQSAIAPPSYTGPMKICEISRRPAADRWASGQGTGEIFRTNFPKAGGPVADRWEIALNLRSRKQKGPAGQKNRVKIFFRLRR